MNKTFTTLLVAGLGTILVSISAQAGGLLFDAKDNLFEAKGDAMFASGD
jgi:hypothetical protein